MKQLVFATHNKHKLSEIQQMVGDHFEIVSLDDLDLHEEIPETSDTLEGNALQKAEYVNKKFGLNCFADDTGLEVAALNGAPGVYSARYAGEQCTFDDNMNKLLESLNGVSERKAAFRTVIALILNGETIYFEGIAEGEITVEKSGAEGFGYDPVFKPSGYDKTFAELGNEEKNKISHRARAIKKLIDFLLKY